MDCFKFPIQFSRGQVRKLADSSDEYFAQLLALSVQIIPGELPITQTYGIEDPTFQTSLTRDLAFTAGAFIPEIFIEQARIRQNENGEVQVTLSFAKREQYGIT
jgi:hypothetical protein